MRVQVQWRSRCVCITVFGAFAISSLTRAQQPPAPLGLGRWLTFAANIPDAGYRDTQFFAPGYDNADIEWDSRLEFWLPPSRDQFSWGPYIRFAGIAGSRTGAFPNAWLAWPGAGFQLYPFSTPGLREPDSKAGKILGPLRFFAEYNRTNYWGSENSWRPRQQSRIGFEYWKAVNVNDLDHAWWLEMWNGAYWQSSNEFTDRYDSVILANALRTGVRKPGKGVASAITPYLAVENSRTKYDYSGSRCGFASCDFYWENGVWAGGGLRYAPSIPQDPANAPSGHQPWLRRFVIYAEYLRAGAYYGPTAPPSVPRFDILVGVSASIGNWYP